MKIHDFIVQFEGYHRKLPNGDCAAYPDPGSDDGTPWTIGFGTTSYNAKGFAKYQRRDVRNGDTLTKDQAESELEYDITICAQTVDELNPNLTDNQHAAAVSFFFNNGFYDPKTGGPSLQSQRLKNGKLKEFRDAMPAYIKGGNNKPLPGLITRRAKECALWDSNDPVDQVKDISRLGDQGEAVEEIHRRLAFLNYLGEGDHGDKFTHATYDAVQWFQRSTGLWPDGIVGPKTLAALETAVTVKKQAASSVLPSIGYMTLRIAERDKAIVKPGWRGLIPLCLTIGNEGDYLIVASGQSYAQNFRKPSDPKSRPGCMEPIPQGVYTVGRIEWAGGVGNYSASFGPGLGPVWVAINPTFKDDRSAFGFHHDSGPAGSAGCVVMNSIDDLRTFVRLVQKFKPKELRVEWGLT